VIITVTGIETIELEDPMGVCQLHSLPPIVPNPRPPVSPQAIAQQPAKRWPRENEYRENVAGAENWRRGITWVKNYR